MKYPLVKHPGHFDPVFSTDIDRAVYNRVRQALYNMTGSAEFIINQATLRMEQVADPNANSYTFDMYEGATSADRPLENKLNRNDLFFVTHVGLAITKQDILTGGVDKYGNYPLFTYPDKDYFDGDNTADLLEWQALECIYNGKLTLVTSSVKRFEDFLTHNLRYVPETQWDPTADTGTLPGYGALAPGRGYARLNPNIIIDGAQTNKFELTLGAGDRTEIDGAVNAANMADNERNVLVLLLNGFRAANAAEKAGRWNVGVF